MSIRRFRGVKLRGFSPVAQLDGTDNSTTLPDSMDFRVRVLFLLVAASLAFPEFSRASVIFKPGEKAKYVAPGDATPKMRSRRARFFERPSCMNNCIIMS
jgi:hypothetical protein